MICTPESHQIHRYELQSNMLRSCSPRQQYFTINIFVSRLCRTSEGGKCSNKRRKQKKKIELMCATSSTTQNYMHLHGFILTHFSNCYSNLFAFTFYQPRRFIIDSVTHYVNMYLNQYRFNFKRKQLIHTLCKLHIEYFNWYNESIQCQNTLQIFIKNAVQFTFVIKWNRSTYTFCSQFKIMIDTWPLFGCIGKAFNSWADTLLMTAFLNAVNWDDILCWKSWPIPSHSCHIFFSFLSQSITAE